MQENIEWFRILVKMQICRKSTWILAGIIVLFLTLMKDISIPRVENNTVVLCDQEQSRVSEALMEQLLTEESAFGFVTVSEESVLKQWIRKGNACCGFLIPKGFTDQLESGRQENLLTYVCASGNAKGKIAKETVYANLFLIYSDHLLEKNGDSITDQRLFFEDVRERKQMYLDSDALFYVEIQEKNQKDTGQKNDLTEECDPIHGMIAVFILTSILLVFGENLDKGRKGFFAALRPGDRLRFSVLQYGAVGIVAALPSVFYIGFTESVKQAFIQVLLLSGFIGICIVWVMVLQRFWKRTTRYYAWMMSLVVSNMMAAPVFLDLSIYLPVLRVVRNLFPVGIYINVLNMIK